MTLGFDQSSLETLSEEMTPPFVSLVEALGVHAIEPMQAARQCCQSRLDDEVVMVRHQAKGVTTPLESICRFCEKSNEEAVIVRVAKDLGPRDAARRYVVRAVSQEVSRAARHVPTVRRSWARLGPAAKPVPLTSHNRSPGRVSAGRVPRDSPSRTGGNARRR
jgi:hypothetical protein